MLKKILLIFILLPLTGFSQNVQTLREQAAVYYNNGDFLKSYETLNKIKDKKALADTDINFQKAHLENILEYRFFRKIKLNDSLCKVYIKTNILKSQGIYNEKLKKYTVPPIYDSIPYSERYFKYLPIYKNNQEAYANIETGKIIIPLGKHNSMFYGDYILVSQMKKDDRFSFDDLISVYDLNGNLVLKEMNTFKIIYYPNLVATKNENNKYKIFDIKEKKTILNDCDYILNPTGGIVEDNVSYENLWLPFHKNGKDYLYKLTAKDVFDTHKFDTYVLHYRNYYSFDSALTNLILLKENAPFINDTINRIRFFSYYTIVKKDNKYGIFNISKDQYYKEPIYDSITKNGNTFYNGKWINLIYGEEIITPNIKNPNGIIFKKNNLFGLMDLGGKIIAEADYDEIRFLSNTVFILRKGEKWGFVGVEKEDKIVSPEFDYIENEGGFLESIACYKSKKRTEYFRNGRLIGSKDIEDQEQKKHIYFDPSSFNTILIDLDRRNEFDRIIFEKKGKYGLDEGYYKEIVAPKYDKLEYGKKNTFIASLGSFVGLIDLNGKEIIPLKYKNVECLDYVSDLFFVTFDNGLKAIFNSEGVMLYAPEIKEAAVFHSDPVTKTSYVTIPAESQKNSENKAEDNKNVIEIKNGKAQKIKLEGSYFLFLNSNNIMVGSDYKRYKTFFYDLKNQKSIDGQFNYYYIYDHDNRRIFAKRGYYYDTVIDSLGNVSNLKQPFEKLENDNYFFNEGDNTGVMNKKMQVANFRYPAVLSCVGREYRSLTPFPSEEYCTKASSYFRFNTNSKSNKYGIVKFDGTVVVEPEIYSSIDFHNFGSDKNNQNSIKNELEKKYENDLFICKKEKKEYDTLEFITGKKELVASFEIHKRGSWRFSDYNNSIIITSPDSVKVYDLKSKKIEFVKKAKQIMEDKDSVYTISLNGEKPSEIRYESYDLKGNLISTTFLDTKAPSFKYIYQNNIVEKNDKYGAVSLKGKQVIPFEYDYLQNINGNLFISKKDNVFGIIDGNNQTIIDKKYQEIQFQDIKYKYDSFRNAFLGYKIKEKNKWGLLDYNLKTLLPIEFDDVKVMETIITARKDSIVNVYYLNGKEIFSAAVDSVDLDSNNAYRIYKNGKKLFRDFNTGKITDTNHYLTWGDQLKIKYSKEIGGKYFLVKNDIVIHKIPLISVEEVDVAEDLVRETLQYLRIKDENNFYGLYTLDFQQIIPFVYNEIIVQKNEDFFIVNKDGKYGVINSKNQILIPFEYDKISFDYRVFFNCTKNKKVYHITPEGKRIWVKMPKVKKQKD